MTPFLQFRVWLRRGPAAERVAAGLAALLVAALVGWSLVPVDNEDSQPTGLAAGDSLAASDALDTGATADGVDAEALAGGDPATGAATAAGPGGAAGRTRTMGSGQAGPGGIHAGSNCTGLRASDQGVTDSEVLVAVPILSLGGDVGNETFNIRPDLEAVANAAAAGINSEGGVACRKLRIRIWRVNPLDQNDQRSKCLEIVAAKPFAVIDFGSYLTPVSRSCFTENKLPYQGALPLTEEEVSTSYPYIYSVATSGDRALRSWVAEAAARGTFDPRTFRKLGVLMTACEPKINEELLRNLNSAGVKNDQMSTFTISCTPVAPPNQLAQAMAQHREDGASHVLFAASVSNAQSYVRNADQVRWKPIYLGSDYGAVVDPTSENGWGAGFDGTIGITSIRTGEINSGMTHRLAAPCQAWYRRANVRPPETDGDPAFYFCTFFRVFQAMTNVAGPNLVRSTLLEAMPRVGRFESVSYLDALYDRRGKVTGGDFIRAVQWKADCTCWRVVDRDPKPGR